MNEIVDSYVEDLGDAAAVLGEVRRRVQRFIFSFAAGMSDRCEPPELVAGGVGTQTAFEITMARPLGSSASRHPRVRVSRHSRNRTEVVVTVVGPREGLVSRAIFSRAPVSAIVAYLQELI